MKVYQAALAFIAIMLGGGIYISERSYQLRMFYWFESFDIFPYISEIRGVWRDVNVELPSFAIYSLPTGLWVFSFTLLMSAIWADDDKMFLTYAGPFFLVAVAAEILQLSIVPGTFTITDVTANLTGFATAIGIRHVFKKRIQR